MTLRDLVQRRVWSRRPKVAAAPVVRASRSEWRQLPPIQRSVQAGSTILESGFAETLATAASPSFLADLGHFVVPDGPGGVVHAAPAEPEPAPGSHGPPRSIHHRRETRGPTGPSAAGATASPALQRTLDTRVPTTPSIAHGVDALAPENPGGGADLTDAVVPAWPTGRAPSADVASDVDSHDVDSNGVDSNGVDANGMDVTGVDSTEVDGSEDGVGTARATTTGVELDDAISPLLGARTEPGGDASPVEPAGHEAGDPAAAALVPSVAARTVSEGDPPHQSPPVPTIARSAVPDAGRPPRDSTDRDRRSAKPTASTTGESAAGTDSGPAVQRAPDDASSATIVPTTGRTAATESGAVSTVRRGPDDGSSAAAEPAPARTAVNESGMVSAVQRAFEPGPSTDGASIDAVPMETGSMGAGSMGAGSTDVGSEDVGPADVGSVDAAPTVAPTTGRGADDLAGPVDTRASGALSQDSAAVPSVHERSRPVSRATPRQRIGRPVDAATIQRRTDRETPPPASPPTDPALGSTTQQSRGTIGAATAATFHHEPIRETGQPSAADPSRPWATREVGPADGAPRVEIADDVGPMNTTTASPVPDVGPAAPLLGEAVTIPPVTPSDTAAVQRASASAPRPEPSGRAVGATALQRLVDRPASAVRAGAPVQRTPVDGAEPDTSLTPDVRPTLGPVVSIASPALSADASPTVSPAVVPSAREPDGRAPGASIDRRSLGEASPPAVVQRIDAREDRHVASATGRSAGESAVDAPTTAALPASLLGAIGFAAEITPLGHAALAASASADPTTVQRSSMAESMPGMEGDAPHAGLRAVDGVQPSIQRATEPTAAVDADGEESAVSAADADGSSPFAGASEADVVVLMRTMYPHLRRRLTRDLLLDRDRSGYRTDIRY